MQNELYHHGVKGQKWGVRRFQKIDGSMTPEGKRKAAIKNLRRATKHIYNEGHATKIHDMASKAGKNDPMAKYKNSTGYDKHNIAIEKIKESRAILGKQYADKIMRNQIARQNVKQVAASAATAAGLAVASSLYGYPMPVRSIAIGSAITTRNAIDANNTAKSYLKNKKLYN